MGLADFLKDKTNRRNVLIGAIAAILVVVLYLLMRAPPVSVDIGPVDQGEVEIAIEGEGKTRVREIYTVSAPITGRMDRITFESGDPVTAEETVLARIEPADPTFLDVRSAAQAKADLDAAKAAVDLARAKLTRAEAERTFARSELKRAEELYQRANISARGLEMAQLEERMRSAEVETARSDLSVALASLEAAKARLIQPSDQRGQRPDSCCVAVRSPISGQVLRVPDKSERVVTSGEALIEVGDPTDLEAVIDVLSTDAVKVKPGDAAFIEHWAGGLHENFGAGH
jgi:HlyD family secretion protein